MPERGRVMRNIAAAVLIIGLVIGTVVWQRDDTWPLAQMRMFPGGSESSLAITWLMAERADGKTNHLNPFAFHLKLADIEGQYSRWRTRPQMLGDLVRAYNKTVPASRRIVRLRVVRREVHGHLPNGKPKWTSRELARWPA